MKKPSLIRHAALAPLALATALLGCAGSPAPSPEPVAPSNSGETASGGAGPGASTGSGSGPSSSDAGSAATTPTGSSAACTVDSDCAPASTCHPTTCVPRASITGAGDMVCTRECRANTLDCGGRCACEQGRCTAHFATNP